MTKEMLKAKVIDIMDMNYEELSAFREVVSMSDIDSKAKFFIYDACDMREAELDSEVRIENGEISLSEMES